MIGNSFDLILNSDMDLFLGDVLDRSDKNYELNKIILLRKLSKILRDSNRSLNISIDSDQKQDKEFILLNRKK